MTFADLVTLSVPQAVLNMDNSVVDLETLQALYENVSTREPEPGVYGQSRNKCFFFKGAFFCFNF